MKVELEPEEVLELLDVITARLLDEAGLADGDRAALRQWRAASMRPGSEGMRELTAKLNADLARVLQTKARSAVMHHDWQ